jgi:hypothetical protein
LEVFNQSGILTFRPGNCNNKSMGGRIGVWEVIFPKGLPLLSGNGFELRMDWPAIDIGQSPVPFGPNHTARLLAN